MNSQHYNFDFFGASETGLFRKNNEDFWLSLPESGFFALTDGIGGRKGGKVAAQTTLEELGHSFQTLTSYFNFTPNEFGTNLKDLICKTNNKIYLLGQSEPSLKGMGTTLCCLSFFGRSLFIAYVGDSRIYRFRDGQLRLLTKDHRLITQKNISKELAVYKNVITKAIGPSPSINPPINQTSVQSNDTFFMCSDGVTDVVEHEEIESILKKSLSIQDATQKLLLAAQNNNTHDNATILMVHVK